MCNSPARVAASAGNGLRVVPGTGITGPQRSGPQLLHAAAAARAGLVAVVGGISAAARPRCWPGTAYGKAGRRPRAPRRPRPPPAQRKQQQSRACRPGFPAAVAQKKPPGNQQTGGLFPSTARAETAAQHQRCRAKNNKLGSNPAMATWSHALGTGWLMWAM